MRSRSPAGVRIGVLARMRVGTKLLLLVLLPVCALLGFTVLSVANRWRDADRLRDFRSATGLSFPTAVVADALAAERLAAVIRRVRSSAAARNEFLSGQRGVDAALRRAVRRTSGREGSVDVAGRLDAAGRQVRALRREVATGSLSAEEIADGYGVIAAAMIGIVRDLDAGRPSRASGRAADAYVALLQAIEAAERERVNLAAFLAAPVPEGPPFPLRWVALESAELDTFRQNATGRLTAELDALLFHRAGLSVRRVRERLAQDPRTAVDPSSLGRWLAASGGRIGELRRLERQAAGELAEAALDDLDAARAEARRELVVLLAVLVLVSALALALRRSITRPLREVSEGAHMLSSGDLTFDVSYAGRDEIGDVAASFRELRIRAERLADEIRAMNVAISENRLDHRADVSGFRGTWAQLLGGMNDTMAAFAGLHSRRRRAEREAVAFFNLSLDLLCIAGADGYLKRVNPAFERTLGYASRELLSRPFVEFVHPDDRARTSDALTRLGRGDEFSHFENRHLHRDGSVRWLQWSARPVPEEGLIYAAARDVTDSRRNRDEQAALRRVATLAAEGAPPAILFGAVAEEVERLLSTGSAQVLRYEPDGSATVLGAAPAGPAAENGGVGADGARARHSDDSLAAPIVVEDRLWGAIVATAAEPRPLPPDTEARLASFTELVATAIANAESRAELAASRARVVTAADEARRRIERDLHDGVQQRLVSLGLEVRTAEWIVPAEATELKERLSQIATGLNRTFEDLREIAMGIHPGILSKGGLGPALKSLARRCAVPVEVESSLPSGSRLPEQVEVAAYYVVSEALTNSVKHARASVVRIGVVMRGDRLQLSIRDDGVGGAKPGGGSGLVGLADRVHALGGTIDITSPPGSGTVLQVILPIVGG
ncbi:MAG: PAS domain S-box protein [Actinobacteria bacterium]|nr:MAG: PAS domain S-box protein [Actinomycetota bacterium]